MQSFFILTLIFNNSDKLNKLVNCNQQEFFSSFKQIFMSTVTNQPGLSHPLHSPLFFLFQLSDLFSLCNLAMTSASFNSACIFRAATRKDYPRSLEMSVRWHWITLSLHEYFQQYFHEDNQQDHQTILINLFCPEYLFFTDILLRESFFKKNASESTMYLCLAFVNNRKF